MQPQYYVLKPDGERLGPFDEKVVRDMVASGEISLGDKLEDATSGSIWEPSIFSPPPSGAPGPTKSKGMSPVAWVLIGVCLLCVPCVGILAAVLFPVFSQAKIAAQATSTLHQLKKVGVSVALYQIDFDDKFPPKMESVANVWPYVRSYARSVDVPVSKNPGHPDFVGNAKLAGANGLKISSPNRTFEFFDSAPWKHDKRAVVFVDSHAAMVKEDDVIEALMNNMVQK